MVIKRHLIQDLLRELDTIVEELSKYRETTQGELVASLSLRWTVERGLIAAANVVFDLLDHILAAAYGVYPESYEEVLRTACEKGVLSEALYARIRGLGGFRNILVHEYTRVNVGQLREHLQKAFQEFPEISHEIQRWLSAHHG